MMRSSNPVLQDTTFGRMPPAHYAEAGTMTVGGVVVKSLVLLLSVLLTGGFVWMKFVKSGMNPEAVSGWMMFGLIGGFILAMVTAFKATWAPMTSIFYALLEGLFLGGISAIFEASYPGIVVQAALLTSGTLLSMLMVYSSGLIKATERFRLGVFAATGGIALVYLATWILSFFSINVGFVTGNGVSGILFSLFVVVIAALNFVIDFDFIEQGAKRGAPKYMEWYGAFALMVTLVWLYIEFLRLLAKLRSRN